MKNRPRLSISTIAWSFYVCTAWRCRSKYKMYDNADIVQTRLELMKTGTLDEIDTFYKVLHQYLLLFVGNDSLKQE